jgi:hypothetical protein
MPKQHPASLKKQIEIAVASVTSGNDNKPVVVEKILTAEKVKWSTEIYVQSPEGPVHGRDNRHLIFRLTMSPLSSEAAFGAGMSYPMGEYFTTGYMVIEMTCCSEKSNGIGLASDGTVPLKLDYKTYNLTPSQAHASLAWTTPIVAQVMGLYAKYILAKD